MDSVVLSSVTASRWLIPPINNRMGFLWRYQHRRSVAQCSQRSNTNQGNTMYIHLYIYTYTYVAQSIPSLWVDVFLPNKYRGGELGGIEGFELATFFPCECCENQAETYIDYYVFIDIQRSRIPFRKLPKTQERQIHHKILYTNPTLQVWTELSNHIKSNTNSGCICEIPMFYIICDP